MENLSIMKKLKKYSECLKEVVRRMREKNRIKKNGEKLSLGGLKIVFIKRSVSILAYTKDSSLVVKGDIVIPWHQFYEYVEYVEDLVDLPVEIEDGLEEAIAITREMAKKYPQLIPLDLELVEITQEDII